MSVEAAFALPGPRLKRDIARSSRVCMHILNRLGKVDFFMSSSETFYSLIISVQ
jgi:hypothetical protein